MLDAPAQEESPRPDDPERRLATWLAAAGLAPIAVLSVWLAGIPADHIWRDISILLLASYGAIVLSFLGGSRWGLAVAGHGTERQRDLAVSMAPPLIGWLAFLLPPQYGFVVLAVAFAAQGAWDALAGQTGLLPLWFVRLRTYLTIGVVVGMIIAYAATATG